MVEALRYFVQSLTSGEYLFALTVAGVLSLFGFGRAFRALHDQRMLSATPTSWLRSAAQGYTELIGRGIAIPGDKLVSPFSGRECLWFRIRTEEVGSDKRAQADSLPIVILVRTLRDLFTEGRWRGQSLLDKSSDDLFYLDDDTGRCVIDPEGANIHPTLKRRWYGNSPTPDRGPAVGGSVLGSQYRYTEELLLPGDILYAIGDLKTHGGATSATNQQDEVRTLLTEWKADQASLLTQFDQDGNGQICLKEWQAVRAHAEELITQRHRQNEVPLAISMLQTPSESRRPYIISSEPIHRLEANYRQSIIINMLIACVGIAGLLMFIVQRS